MSLRKLKEKKAAAVAGMESILAKAAEEDRELIAEEVEEFDNLKSTIPGLDAQIARFSDVENARASMKTDPAAPAAASGYQPTNAPGAPAKKEFESLGEFIHAVRFNSNDQRLQFQATQNTESGEDGGFAIPTQFIPELRRAQGQQAVIRPRATVIQPGSPPDSEVTMPALNQSDTNMRGGVQVNWIGEGDAKPETGAKFRDITVKPQEVAAHVVLTDKLLRNWQASNSVISGLLNDATVMAEENAFMQGNGVAKPLGIVNSAAFIAVDRDTGDDIIFDDIALMMGSVKVSPGLVWTYNPTILPKLLSLADGAGRLIFITGDATKGIPNTLMGYPAIPNENNPVLGDPGDLVLADWSNYLIKDGSGPLISASPHVHFVNNKTVIKITWNVDGQPWLNDTLLGEDGIERSPFVGLAA